MSIDDVAVDRADSKLRRALLHQDGFNPFPSPFLARFSMFRTLCLFVCPQMTFSGFNPNIGEPWRQKECTFKSSDGIDPTAKTDMIASLSRWLATAESTRASSSSLYPSSRSTCRWFSALNSTSVLASRRATCANQFSNSSCSFIFLSIHSSPLPEWRSIRREPRSLCRCLHPDSRLDIYR